MRRLFSQEPTQNRISVLLKQPCHARWAILAVLFADLSESRELFGQCQRRFAHGLAIQKDQCAFSCTLKSSQPVSNDGELDCRGQVRELVGKVHRPRPSAEIAEQAVDWQLKGVVQIMRARAGPRSPARGALAAEGWSVHVRAQFDEFRSKGRELEELSTVSRWKRFVGRTRRPTKPRIVRQARTSRSRGRPTCRRP